MKTADVREVAISADPDAAAVTGLPTFAHAFQPIVDTVARRIVSHEALVRGSDGGPAFRVFQHVPPAEMHRFDGILRNAAIARAVALNLEGRLNLNCLPQGLCRNPELLAETMEEAARCGLSPRRIVLEVTEGEIISDCVGFAALMNVHRARGVKVAIDDFGAGYAGLNLLADFQPDEVKIDMNLIRGIEVNGPRQAIVRAVIQACQDLAIDVIAEGVETVQEYLWCADHGVRRFQGYLFARPMFDGFPEVTYPPPRCDMQVGRVDGAA